MAILDLDKLTLYGAISQKESVIEGLQEGETLRAMEEAHQTALAAGRLVGNLKQFLSRASRSHTTVDCNEIVIFLNEVFYFKQDGHSRISLSE